MLCDWRRWCLAFDVIKAISKRLANRSHCAPGLWAMRKFRVWRRFSPARKLHGYPVAVAEGKRFLERGRVFSRGEAFSPEGKRFLKRGSVFSKESASSLEKRFSILAE